jgi:DNA-binding NarL/FixJ family response regulator
VPTIDIEERQSTTASTASTAALIAAGWARDQIVGALELQGVQTKELGSVEDVAAGGEIDTASVVVLCVEDASPLPLARALGPLARRLGETPIIVVCADIQRSGIRTALTRGAVGVVLYDELETALGPCLGAVLAGQICVPRAHGQLIEPPVLSSREKQILGLVVMGYMNSQIAERLFLAESTVKSHLSSAFSKLGVRSRNEAVNLILDPERGLGMGILALGGEPLETSHNVSGERIRRVIASP